MNFDLICFLSLTGIALALVFVIIILVLEFKRAILLEEIYSIDFLYGGNKDETRH